MVRKVLRSLGNWLLEIEMGVVWGVAGTSIFVFVFAAIWYIDPALLTLVLRFRQAACTTSTSAFLVGISNCTWTSCRLGCTREVYRCWQVTVDFQYVRDAPVYSPPWSAAPAKDLQDGDTDEVVHSARLYPNVRGCGYPPDLDCEEFFQEFGALKHTYTCWVSTLDPGIAMTQLDLERAKSEVIFSLIPLLIFILSVLYAFCRHGIFSVCNPLKAVRSSGAASSLQGLCRTKVQVASENNSESKETNDPDLTKVTRRQDLILRLRRQQLAHGQAEEPLEQPLAHPSTIAEEPEEVGGPKALSGPSSPRALPCTDGGPEGPAGVCQGNDEAEAKFQDNNKVRIRPAATTGLGKPQPRHLDINNLGSRGLIELHNVGTSGTSVRRPPVVARSRSARLDQEFTRSSSEEEPKRALMESMERRSLLLYESGSSADANRIMEEAFDREQPDPAAEVEPVPFLAPVLRPFYNILDWEESYHSPGNLPATVVLQGKSSGFSSPNSSFNSHSNLREDQAHGAPFVTGPDLKEPKEHPRGLSGP